VAGAKSDLAFAKIVAFPKTSSWSQAYNAGKLFATLSLKKDSQEEQQSPDLLSVLGKKVLDKLEEEFFTIEVKDLESIKQAVITTLKEISDEITSSFTAVVFVDNVLYSFAKGGGKVFIKRNDKFGAILETTDEDLKFVTSSSGSLEANDLIILVTQPFLDIFDTSSLSLSLGNLTPNEVAETLTPKIHEKDDGGAAVFIVRYTKETPQPSISKTETIEEAKSPQLHASFAQFSHSKKKFLTIAVVILIILAGSIFFAIKKQNDSKTKDLFKEIYASALKKYDEGSSLLDLNKSLAIDSLTFSKKLLSENKDKFSSNSKEQNEILVLLKKVDKALEIGSSANQVKAKEISSDSSFYLKTQIANSKTNLFSQDDNSVYFLDSNGITSIDKKTNKKEVIIKNDNHWKSAVGLAAYLGNIYVLDKNASQILKFVEAKDGFTKTNYFTDTTPDLSNAINITIDGSIWILFKDGSIQKFTKGKKDSFILSGFKESISNPTRIFTNADTKNIYILNTSKASILVFGKDGTYQSQYQSDILKGAKDFEVKEADKKVYVLSQNKVYSIEAK
jgi:cell division protein FtsL